jgi:hypothetical protein
MKTVMVWQTTMILNVELNVQIIMIRTSVTLIQTADGKMIEKAVSMMIHARLLRKDPRVIRHALMVLIMTVII